MREFVATYSDAPPTTPLFTLRADSGGGVLVHSQLAATSGANVWFAQVMVPSTPGFYVYAFVSSYASGPSAVPQLVQVIATAPSWRVP